MIRLMIYIVDELNHLNLRIYNINRSLDSCFIIFKYFCSSSRQLLLVTSIFLLHQLLLLVKVVFSNMDKPWPQRRFLEEVEAVMVAPQQRKPRPN